ncbi:MAG: hypothetical protein ABSE54_08940 [Smithella sp.]
MIDIKEDSFISLYKNTLAPSKVVCQKEFTFSGYSYGDVFELAAGLKKTLARRGQEKVLCLCTVNKAVTAACVLASLAGSCKLILPYSFSAHAVTEMYDATGFNFAIADHPEEMPAGVETIMPLPAAAENNRTELIRDPDEPFLCLFTGGSTGKPRVWSKSPRNLFAAVLVSMPIHYRALKVDNLLLPSLKVAFSSSGALDRSDGLHFYKKTDLGITEIYGSTETGGIASRSISEHTDSWKPFDVVSWKLTGSRLSVKSDFTSPEMERDPDGFCPTGDEASEDKENRFVLLGRADGIVKVAGKRVDLLDVQNKIKTLPTVSDAVVVAFPTDKGRESVIAAVVACDLTETHLKKLLMDMLEPYAVPRRVKIVSSIARTATGKIDRRRIEKFFLT